jgi:uncharacterized membrane protein
MTLDPRVLLVIAGMGLLTYLTRIGGNWLAGRVARPERLEAWLAPAPGAILSAVVAPAVVTAGWQGIVALGVIVILMARLGNLLLAAAVGTALIALLRW